MRLAALAEFAVSGVGAKVAVAEKEGVNASVALSFGKAAGKFIAYLSGETALFDFRLSGAVGFVPHILPPGLPFVLQARS